MSSFLFPSCDIVRLILRRRSRGESPVSCRPEQLNARVGCHVDFLLADVDESSLSSSLVTSAVRRVPLHELTLILRAGSALFDGVGPVRSRRRSWAALKLEACGARTFLTGVLDPALDELRGLNAQRRSTTGMATPPTFRSVVAAEGSLPSGPVFLEVPVGASSIHEAEVDREPGTRPLIRSSLTWSFSAHCLRERCDSSLLGDPQVSRCVSKTDGLHGETFVESFLSGGTVEDMHPSASMTLAVAFRLRSRFKPSASDGAAAMPAGVLRLSALL